MSEWERLLGIPDACSGALSSGLTDRRRVVWSRLTAAGEITAATMVRIAEDLGYTAQVVEHRQAQAGAIPGLDTSAGRWRHVWWLRVDASSQIRRFDTLSDVTESLVEYPPVTELECRIRAASPAHTYPVVEIV